MSRSGRTPGAAGAPHGSRADTQAPVPPTRRPLVNEIEIGAAPEVVFDYLTDVRNEPQWNPRMSWVEKLTPGAIGRGTRFRVRFGRGLREALIEQKAFDRPRSWSAVSRSRVLDVEAEGRVAEIPDGSRLVIMTRLHPHGALRLAAPLLRRWMRRTWDRDLRAVKLQLEHAGESSRSSREPPLMATGVRSTVSGSPLPGESTRPTSEVEVHR